MPRDDFRVFTSSGFRSAEIPETPPGYDDAMPKLRKFAEAIEQVLKEGNAASPSNGGTLRKLND